MFETRIGATGSVQWLAISLVLFVFGTAIKRRFFSSISDVPGPLITSFSHLWQIQHTITGHTEQETIDLHRRHGMTPRVLLIFPGYS
jgi:hypothetical protein